MVTVAGFTAAQTQQTKLSIFNKHWQVFVIWNLYLCLCVVVSALTFFCEYSTLPKYQPELGTVLIKYVQIQQY